MIILRKCQKCGKNYKGYPATSRVDGSEICPECGTAEALDIAVDAGAVSVEDAEEVKSLVSKSRKLWSRAKWIVIFDRVNRRKASVFVADDAKCVSPNNIFYLDGEEVYRYDEREQYYKSFDYVYSVVLNENVNSSYNIGDIPAETKEEAIEYAKNFVAKYGFFIDKSKLVVNSVTKKDVLGNVLEC